jgi:hypothetical protein
MNDAAPFACRLQKTGVRCTKGARLRINILGPLHGDNGAMLF